MNERFQNQNQGMEVKEKSSIGYIPLLDEGLTYAIFGSEKEELTHWAEYVKRSFFEQFGVHIETEFVKLGNGVQLFLKTKELPAGVKLNELRLFKIMKDDDIHDGHYYLSYDTKGIADLDNLYNDAIWQNAKGLVCEYQSKNTFHGKSVGARKVELSSSLRHHLHTSGGTHKWEIEVPMADMNHKSYLEVFKHPSDESVENVCRELVRRAGAYVIEQMKK